MKSVFINIPIFIFSLFSFCLYAQQDFDNFSTIMNGKVLDDSTKRTIANASIFNESKRTYDYANEKGLFSIWPDIGDTLVFSAVGYLSLVVFVTDSLIGKNKIIKLEPRTYEIGEVTIKSVKSYSKFKQEFLNTVVPRTKLDSVTEELTVSTRKTALEADKEKRDLDALNRDQGEILQLGIPIRTRRDKQQKALNKVARKEQQQKIINEKYNRDIVRDITKLTDSELTDFMAFCNFSFEFLVNSTEYDILKAIMDKFEEYKEGYK